ncbi:MAG: sugar ABC transporter permease [Hyphomicrobiales bacterium]|nr:sugar ABC transporter permease [Hyphomicrobiales bacterium]
MSAISWRPVSTRTAYYLMFAPALILLLAVLYPFVDGVATALTDRKLYLETSSFIGLDNFITLFLDAEFRASLYRTLAYAVAVVVIQIPLGLFIALLLNQEGRLKSILRGALVLPLLIPPVVAGLMWKTMMQPQAGILNWFLQSIGLPGSNWLSHVDTALISVVLIDTWVFTPFAALILLAGLQSIPDDLIEAARVDGARSSLIFRAIQLPWLFPFVVLVALFRISDSLKSFELIYATTRGGPLNATRTLHISGYEEAFRWSAVGRAMAIVFCLWLLSYFVSLFLINLWQRRSPT